MPETVQTLRRGVGGRYGCALASWNPSIVTVMAHPPTPLDSWIAFDIECVNTTLSPLYAGFVEVIGGQVGRRRYWIVRTPGEPYNGMRLGNPMFDRGETITREQYESAPLFVDVWPEIGDFIGGRPLVAHGAARDIGSIRRGFNDVGLPWPRLEFACSLGVARRAWPKRLVAEHGIRAFRTIDLAGYLFPEAGLFEGDYFEKIGHDPVEDAEASARVVLAAQRRTGTSTLRAVLETTGSPMLQVEANRYQKADRSWISRNPIDLPRPRTGLAYRPERLRAAFLDIRACWRGDIELIEGFPHPGDPLPNGPRRRRRA